MPSELSSLDRLAAGPVLPQEVLDLLPAYVAYVDRDLRYLAANRMYVDRFGLPAQSIIGQLVADVTGPAFEQVAAFLHAALDGKPQRFEPRMISVDGERILSVTHIPHSDSAGNIVGVIVYGLDITEQRLAEQALLQAEKLAAVGRLASSIAHEINNPLESVVNLLYLIETSAEEDPQRTLRYAQLAQQELARVTQIATHTLRFYRQTTARRRTDLGELLHSVLALYAGRIASSSVQVLRDGGGATLECYDGEIRQAINNLLSNSLDAMRGGGILRLRVRTVPGGARITIADTGHGMGPEVLRHIFEPFFSTKGISGTGLGLWITRELVLKNHGSLRVRSAPRQGTVITLFLAADSPA